MHHKRGEVTGGDTEMALERLALPLSPGQRLVFSMSPRGLIALSFLVLSSETPFSLTPYLPPMDVNCGLRLWLNCLCWKQCGNYSSFLATPAKIHIPSLTLLFGQFGAYSAFVGGGQAKEQN